MDVKIRGDSVVIDGYVNAVERDSKPLPSRTGQFVERICKGAFARALTENPDVKVLIDHDWNCCLGGTGDGSLQLSEDAIGLRARLESGDPVVIEKARKREFLGWSFGFSDKDVEMGQTEDGLPLRKVRGLDLFEVSLIDRKMAPCYEGTLVNVRGQAAVGFVGENYEDTVTISEMPDQKWRALIDEMEGVLKNEEKTD